MDVEISIAFIVKLDLVITSEFVLSPIHADEAQKPRFLNHRTERTNHRTLLKFDEKATSNQPHLMELTFRAKVFDKNLFGRPIDSSSVVIQVFLPDTG